MAELTTTSLLKDANLQGYWRFENNVNDSGPNGYNLTASGSPTYVVGEYEYGLNLVAASSQYADIANASCPNLEISGSQSWGGWVNVTGSFAVDRFISDKSAGGGPFKQFYIQGTTPKFLFSLSGLTTNTVVSSTISASLDTTYFACGVYDSSATTLRIRVYNSSGTLLEEVSVTASGSATASSANFRIGKNQVPSYQNGWVDDVFIFNRALSNAEIDSLAALTASSGFLGFF